MAMLPSLFRAGKSALTRTALLTPALTSSLAAEYKVAASAVSFAGAWQHAAGQTRGISIDALKPSDR